MSNQQDIVFVDGLIVKRSDEAPDWVAANLSVKVDEIVPWLQQHQSNGWVNIQCLRSKTTGKWYAKLDTWKPTDGDVAKKEVAAMREQVAPPVEDDDIPF